MLAWLRRRHSPATRGYFIEIINRPARAECPGAHNTRGRRELQPLNVWCAINVRLTFAAHETNRWAHCVPPGALRWYGASNWCARLYHFLSRPVNWKMFRNCEETGSREGNTARDCFTTGVGSFSWFFCRNNPRKRGAGRAVDVVTKLFVEERLTPCPTISNNSCHDRQQGRNSRSHLWLSSVKLSLRKRKVFFLFLIFLRKYEWELRWSGLTGGSHVWPDFSFTTW